MGIAHELYLRYQQSIKDKADIKIITDNKNEFYKALEKLEKTDLNETDESEEKRTLRTLLDDACLSEDKELVLYILKRIPKFKPHIYLQELADAVATENREIIDLLLKHGANINQKHPDGFSIFELAAGNADYGGVTLLLEQGADINITNTITKNTVFKYAFESKAENSDKIKLLNLMFLWCWYRNIKVDLTGISIDPLLQDNLLFFGAIKDGKQITATPGFENSIIDYSSFLKAGKNIQRFNFEDIFLAIKFCIEHTKIEQIDQKLQDSLLKFVEDLKKLWQKQEMVKGLTYGYIFYCADHTTFFQQKKIERAKMEKTFAGDLERKITDLTAKLTIKLPQRPSS